MSREEVQRFQTDEGRAVVQKFMTDALAEEAKANETSAGETGRREAMTDERLAEIKRHHASYSTHPWVGIPACCSAHASADDVPGLLTEVQRLRDLNAELSETLDVRHDETRQAKASAEAAERALEEMRGRHDVMGHTRAEIAAELREARRWHPDNAYWTQDMDQAARIVEIGMDGYAEENRLPRLGGFVRGPRVGSEQKASDDA